MKWSNQQSQQILEKIRYTEVSVCGESVNYSNITQKMVCPEYTRLEVCRSSANIGCNYARSGAHAIAETFLFFANMVHETENLTNILQKLLDVQDLVNTEHPHNQRYAFHGPHVAKEAKGFLVLDNSAKHTRQEQYRLIRRITEMELSPVYKRFHLSNRQDTEGFTNSHIYTQLSEKLWRRGYHQASDDCVRYGALVQDKLITAMRAAQYLLIEMSHCAMEHGLETQSDTLLSLLFTTKDQVADKLLETIEEYLET